MRVSLRLLQLAIIAVVVMASHALAHAQQSEKKKVASTYVEAGIAAQATGDYRTAVTMYEKAYAVLPHPELLYNLAQAHRLDGRLDIALGLYERYLIEDPTGRYGKVAREWIDDIHARKAELAKLEETRRADEARKAQEARKLEEARIAETRRTDQTRRAHELGTSGTGDAGAGAGAGPSGAHPAVQAVASDRTAARARTLRLAGIAAGAAGGVSLAVGLGFGLHAKSLRNEQVASGMFSADRDRSARSANGIAIGTMVGGGALVVAGAAMYWLGHRQATHGDRVTLAPMVSDQTAGVVVSGSLP
jgi:tetratricopeptide (TPR) repeat protein